MDERIYPPKRRRNLYRPSIDSKPVRPFDGLVRIAQGADEFERQVVVALEEQDEELRQRRLAVARENSWERRAEAALGVIEALLREGQL